MSTAVQFGNDVARGVAGLDAIRLVGLETRITNERDDGAGLPGNARCEFLEPAEHSRVKARAQPRVLCAAVDERDVAGVPSIDRAESARATIGRRIAANAASADREPRRERSCVRRSSIVGPSGPGLVAPSSNSRSSGSRAGAVGAPGPNAPDSAWPIDAARDGPSATTPSRSAAASASAAASSAIASTLA